MNTYTPEAHAAGLTDSELAEMLDTVPASALGSPLHAALVKESHARAAKAEAAPADWELALMAPVENTPRHEVYGEEDLDALNFEDAMMPTEAELKAWGEDK